MHLLHPVRRGNAFEETVEQLLSALTLGIFAPGERLPAERPLAERLGVSRATLREALSELQSAGYLRIERGRYGGAIVADEPPRATWRGDGAPVDPARVHDVLTFRAIIEPAAAELAAQRIDDAGRALLAAALADTQGCEPGQFRPLDARFHLAIAELSGSPLLLVAVGQVRARVNDLLDRIPVLAANVANSDEQHAAVAAAIAAGDAAEARARMAEHLEGTALLLRGFLGG